MKNLILALSNHIHTAIHKYKHVLTNRQVTGFSPHGDAQFSIDQIAEASIREFLIKYQINIMLKTEDGQCEPFGKNPQKLLLIDPIDGSRPAAAGLEMANISIAIAPYKEDVTIGQLEYALIREINTPAYLYADKFSAAIESHGYSQSLPCFSQNTELSKLFWSCEFNGHPSQFMLNAYGHLIDLSANTGGVFVFNSASYSITRILTGQLDAYVDIGNRLLKDNPGLLRHFTDVGNGKVLHLFPYDIAAPVYIAMRCNMPITDGYENSLTQTRLLDYSYKNQQSCIAASNAKLHEKIMKTIRW